MRREKQSGVSPNHPPFTCEDHIYEKKQIFDKLKAMNLRVNNLAMKIKKAEKELKQMKEVK